MGFLTWLENTSVSQWILIDAWGHPLLLAAHSIGMAVVVGITLMLDLRVLGFAPGIRISTFRQLIAFAWGGFALNTASGVLMFMAYATTLIGNWTFLLKLAFIVAGGISVWLLWRAIEESETISGGEDMTVLSGAGPGGAVASRDVVIFSDRAKLLAVLTALFWLGAIVAGRFIAYTLPEGA